MQCSTPKFQLHPKVFYPLLNLPIDINFFLGKDICPTDRAHFLQLVNNKLCCLPLRSPARIHNYCDEKTPCPQPYTCHSYSKMCYARPQLEQIAREMDIKLEETPEELDILRAQLVLMSRDIKHPERAALARKLLATPMGYANDFQKTRSLISSIIPPLVLNEPFESTFNEGLKRYTWMRSKNWNPESHLGKRSSERTEAPISKRTKYEP